MEPIVTGAGQMLLSQSPLVVMLAVLAWLFWKSDKAREKRNDEWIQRVLVDKDKEIAEIKQGGKECEARHEATRARLERIALALAKLPNVDIEALMAAPTRREIMDMRP